jgi:hypothetical protein
VKKAILLRAIKRTLLWATVALATIALSLCVLITWPAPLFAFSLGSGKIIVASDRPIPPSGGERFLRDYERLLAGRRSKPRGANTGSMSPTRSGDSAYSSSQTQNAIQLPFLK